jgi:hypothetical protein
MGTSAAMSDGEQPPRANEGGPGDLQMETSIDEHARKASPH